MKEGATNRIITLLTLSIIIMVFVYQCHPVQPESKNLDIYRKPPPVKLDDIREGSLLRKIDGTGLYEVLPQMETRTEINIEGMVSSTTVEQKFTNASDEPVEAVYVFPLPRNAAVHDMKMLINDRLIQGEIKEREEAKKTYEYAKAEGRHAALTEQERPNVFTNTVANIMPGDIIIVRLQFVDKLTYEDGVFRLRFPIVVAPRYIPGSEIKGHSGSGRAYDTDIVPDASRITPPVAPPGMRTGSTISLKVNINAGLPVSSINSISHDINITQVNEEAYSVHLKKKKVIPNRDFVLEYRIRSAKEPKVALVASPKAADTYFMLMAVPPVSVKSDESLKKEIVFVLDISGSMSGTSIKQAGNGLINALTLLSGKDYFNIVVFNDRYESFASSSVQASGTSIMNAVNYINNLNAGGGTEARPALEHALKMPQKSGALKMIVFLTDGSVGNENQLIDLVNSNIGRSRLFTVGIGSAPNGFLLEKISRSGRGTFTFISHINEVEKKMGELFAKIENPVLMDLKLDISDKAETFPDPIADLFAGQPLVVFGKTDKLPPTGTELSGRTADSDFTLNIPLNPDRATEEPAIPTLWARSKISNLMNGYRTGDDEIKQNIIDLAINHKLITKFTSFVAVEQKIVNPGGKTRLNAIPVELPEGWEYEKVITNEGQAKLAYLPQTASNAPLVALVGLVLMAIGSLIGLLKMQGRNGD